MVFWLCDASRRGYMIQDHGEANADYYGDQAWRDRYDK